MPGPSVKTSRDFESVLVKKSLRNSVRTRAMNSREKNLLEEKLLNLERATNRTNGLIRKEINNLMHELSNAEHYKVKEENAESPVNTESNRDSDSEEDETTSSVQDASESGSENRISCIESFLEPDKLISNRILPACKLNSTKLLPYVTSATISGKSRDREERRDTGHRCKYGLTKGECVHFPCILPKTYTTLGYRLTGEPVSPWETTPRVFSPPRISYLGKSGEVDFPKKEKAVQGVFRDLREKNKANKPQDRAVRYGESISRHKLLNPVRPVPAEKIQLSLT
ncbi:uncharacterized protein LOC106176864 [Lingula anatina]|uniref:Uncharacterized protein LOC106176864 n=1 Tax=Lingula anatina TaxID=7574 RepID=A0A1S3JWR8_LINAN|nr:uncharacterized protein LOC106176864 [Lingula anatina]XP_013414873.1 uncharacterized protein LOC106176864 [Lingula anatina]XP_013414874.1 uncharacterized protein LOC106176864 [Lingula anatina]XP_013414875.1 uncharacterized protein LOC106176864 [Lingula anatina]|eukprot:XP_013414872.1 uncharacterized protein LOC106176864 [Lingula anatina]